MFTMKLSNESLEGKDVVPSGLYKVKLAGFKPKFSKLKPGQAEGTPTSLNLNAQMEIFDHANPEYNGRRIFEGLNDAAGFVLQDFSHSFGFALETDGKSSWLAGQWDGEEGKAETYIYKGPLLGQIAMVEIGVRTYNKKDSNAVNRYICRVKDCAQKFPKLTHTMTLIK